MQEERAQVIIYGKNEVPVGAMNEFKGHFSRTINTVFIATGGTKLGMAAERTNLSLPQCEQPYITPP